MKTRPTLNGRPPRTLRDASRDPFDWVDGPHVRPFSVPRWLRHWRVVVTLGCCLFFVWIVAQKF